MPDKYSENVIVTKIVYRFYMNKCNVPCGTAYMLEHLLRSSMCSRNHVLESANFIVSFFINHVYIQINSTANIYIEAHHPYINHQLLKEPR